MAQRSKTLCLFLSIFASAEEGEHMLLLTFSSASTHGSHFGLPICSPPRMGLETRNPLLPSRRNSAFVAWTDCLKTSGTVVKFAAKALAMLGEG
jgi:hypothetical protein